jgi:hypothetical protein
MHSNFDAQHRALHSGHNAPKWPVTIAEIRSNYRLAQLL